MPGTTFDSDGDFDPQDQAEAFDESMTVGGEGDVGLAGDSPLGIGEDMRSFEELPDVYDVTTRFGDRDADEELALNADEFDEDAIDDDNVEDDNELDYGAVDAAREDDLDGLGAEPGALANEEGFSASEIDGLHEISDQDDEVQGGEDDFTDFQARDVGDDDLKAMGYSEERNGETRAKPDEG